MKYIIQHPGYYNKNFVYGFIGKDFPTEEHTYRASEQATINQKKIAIELDKKDSTFCLLKQVHSDKCHIVKDKEFASIEHEGDALVTNQPNLLLGVQTADCVPVLFFDKNKRNIGIAHAGWKGALKGIIKNTVIKLQELGSTPQDIEVVIGPCITQHSYEVDKVFYNKFMVESGENKIFFDKSKNIEHYLFDLPGYVQEKLRKSGIDKIFYLNSNTYNSKKWFSYREDTHKNHKLTGGILSFIGHK